MFFKQCVNDRGSGAWRLLARQWLEVRESVGQASQDKASVAVFSRKNTTDDPSSRLSATKQSQLRRKLNLNHNRTKMVERKTLPFMPPCNVIQYFSLKADL